MKWLMSSVLRILAQLDPDPVNIEYGSRLFLLLHNETNFVKRIEKIITFLTLFVSPRSRNSAHGYEDIRICTFENENVPGEISRHLQISNSKTNYW